MMEKFGQRVRRLRDEQGLSQSALGTRVGLGKPHISKLETSAKPPSTSVIDRLAQALGLSAIDLVEGTDMEGKYVAQRLNASEVTALREQQRVRLSSEIIAAREIYRLIGAYHREFLEGQVLNSPDSLSAANFALLTDALEEVCSRISHVSGITDLEGKLFVAESLDPQRYIFDGFLFEDYVQRWELDALRAGEAELEKLAVLYPQGDSPQVLASVRNRYGLDAIVAMTADTMRIPPLRERVERHSV
jgi:transcriptional regulator with XRE-family HTH domain